MEGFSLCPASTWEAMASLSGCLSRAATELRRFNEGALTGASCLGFHSHLLQWLKGKHALKVPD